MSEKGWVDESSHSRWNDDKVREPDALVLRAGDLRVAVHRHMRYPGAWLLSAEPFANKHSLVATDLEAAKAEALAFVQRRLDVSLAALADSKGATPCAL
jgi:hypothetical protein